MLDVEHVGFDFAIPGALVGLTDILPTFMHGIGLQYPVELGPLPGESLLTCQGGGLGSERAGFFIDYGEGSGRWVALRTATHKYAYWFSGGHEELFDLREDPWETRNLAAEEVEPAGRFRSQVEDWERRHGFASSFDGGALHAFPEPPPSPEDYTTVMINDGRWADNLPPDEQNSVESFAEGFTRAISRETSLAPEKLSIGQYKQKGGDLRDTPWEEAWRKA